MTGILSLTTFFPLIGVAAIVVLRLLGGQADQGKLENAAKWIALATTLATLALSILLVAQFDPLNPGFQFQEDIPWFAGAGYRMGVDGISVLFVLLTAFLLPLCVIASWNAAIFGPSSSSTAGNSPVFMLEDQTS